MGSSSPQVATTQLTGWSESTKHQGTMTKKVAKLDQGTTETKIEILNKGSDSFRSFFVY